MGVKTHRDLDAWRLADQIRQRVVAVTASAPTSKDFKYCNQIRDSASSVPANVAEGFARKSPRDFARFLSIAKGSLLETQDRILDGAERRYIGEQDAVELMQLTARCDRVITRLRAYLWSCTKRN
ncbi:MAG: four helix bundle protein [Vicinamibacterales bacterium]